MLNNLEIEHYQSHVSSSLELHEGLNIICGSSDSGKSAILRALLWAIKNRPMGEGFKNWDAGESDPVTVSCEFDDNWMIKKRLKNKNSYETDNGTYEALRSDVPDEIAEIHRLTDCNIQTQLAPYFLLQDSPGERGKQLNKLVGLDIIDRVTRKINAKAKDTKKELGAANIKVESIKDEISKLPDLTSAESILDRIASRIENIEKTQGELNSLSADVGKLAQCIEETKKLKSFLEVESAYNQLMSKIKKRTETETDRNELQSMVSSIKELQGCVDDDVAWLEVEPMYLSLIAKIDKRNSVEGQIVQIDEVVDALWSAEEQVGITSAKLTERINSYTDILADSGTCPTCLSVVGKETIEHLKTSL